MTFLIARPIVKAQQTLDAFEQLGLNAAIYPIVDIEYSDADQHVIALNRAKPSSIIITSSYASQWFVAQLQKQVLTFDISNVNLVCVGASSAKVLQQVGLNKHLIIASPENSEGLLSLSCLKDVKEQSIALLKGEGGRTLISETLSQRNAKLAILAVYKRVMNTKAVQSIVFEQSEIRCIIATSVEITQFLFDRLDVNWLQRLHWIVASDRIKDYAYSKGVKHLTVSQGAHNQALLASATYLVKTGALHD